MLPRLGSPCDSRKKGRCCSSTRNDMHLVQARHLGYKAEWQIVRVTSDTARAHFMLLPDAHPLDTGR